MSKLSQAAHLVLPLDHVRRDIVLGSQNAGTTILFAVARFVFAAASTGASIVPTDLGDGFCD